MSRTAESLPLSEFRRRYARGGGLWTLAINQRLGAALGRAALSRGVTPRSLSLVNAGTGVATSVVTLGLYPWSPLGASAVALVGWQLAYSADCADGQLARAGGQASEQGAVLDLLCDYVVQLALLIAATSIAMPSLDAPVSGLAVLLAGLWLLAPYYSGIASELVSVSAGVPRRLGLVHTVARSSRDYGLHVALVSIAIAVSPLAVLAVLALVAAANLAFLCSRLIQLARPE